VAPGAAQAKDSAEERGFFSGELGAGDPGDRSGLVWEVERALQAKGFDPGRVDGRFTEKTEEALERYQRARELRADGKLDDETLQALGVGKGFGGTAGFDVGPLGAHGHLSGGRSGLGSGARVGVGPLESGAHGFVGLFGAGGEIDVTVAGVGLGAQAEASTNEIGAALNIYTREDEPQQLGLAINPPFMGRSGTGVDVSVPFVGKQGVGLGQDELREQVEAEPEPGDLVESR
jgi:peptidoglycan hydrolase-like protein with peptidoglycan-binding domain